MTQFKLEVGKMYATVGMDIVKITKEFLNEDGNRYMGDNGLIYLETGARLIDETTLDDLVAEVEESSPKTFSIIASQPSAPIPVTDLSDEDSIIPAGSVNATTANTSIYSFLNLNLDKYPGVTKMKITIPEDHPPVEIEINRSNIVRLIDNY